MGKFKRGALRLIDGNTFSFVSGQRQTLQIPVPATYIKRFWFWLRGTLTISGVTVPGTLHGDGAANLIGQLELLVDGYPLKVGLFPHFLRIAQRYDQCLGVNNGLVSTNAGVYNFECLVPLMFQMPSSVGPFDSILDGRTKRNIVCNLTWGTTANLVIGNTSTLALTNTTVQVYVEETDPFPIKGKPWLFRETEVTFAGILTNVGTRLLMPYNEGSVVRSILLKAVDGSDISDAVINTINLRVNAGEDIPFNTVEDDFFQAWGQYQFGLDFMPDGYYHMELSENGRVLTTGLGAGVAPNQLNTLDIIADTTVGVGATSIIAHICEMVPPKMAA